MVMSIDQCLIRTSDQDKVGVGAAQGRQARGFALEQAAHFEQIIKGAWLRAEQVHQRRYPTVTGKVGDE
ncbi:hypothetical protein D3C86_1697440 [compost metagenome]